MTMGSLETDYLVVGAGAMGMAFTDALIGHAAVQRSGPEAGLQERARQAEILAYYDDVLHRRFVGTGRVTFLGGSDYHAEGSSHVVTSRVSGDSVEIGVRQRVVDATYLSPTI